MIRTRPEPPSLRFSLLLALAGASLVLGACDEDRQAPPRPRQDLALECVPEGMDAGASSDGGAAFGCAAGEVCIQGRCYPPCESDGDCGPGEECGGSGICVRSGGPRPDGGPIPSDGGVDAGPIDPCADVTCEGALVCHPLVRACTECSELSLGAARGEPGFCETNPVCDITNGRCVAVNAAPCQPCNLAADCLTGTDPETLGCVTRSVFETNESVCLPTCAAGETCPLGMTCDAASGSCRPALDISCTTWRRGIAGGSCFGDADCNPLGESGAVVTGACVGYVPPADVPDGDVVTDAGLGTPGVCRQPCGTSEDCATAGYVCDATFFCVPPI